MQKEKQKVSSHPLLLPLFCMYSHSLLQVGMFLHYLCQIVPEKGAKLMTVINFLVWFFNNIYLLFVPK